MFFIDPTPRKLARLQERHIITSLLQQDFYKYGMCRFILEYFPDVQVTFKLVVRAKNLPLALIIQEERLREELDHVLMLRYTVNELKHVKAIGFDDKLIEFLQFFQLPAYNLKRVGDTYELTFSDLWSRVMWWETYALPIICGLKSEAIRGHMDVYEREVYYRNALDKLERDLYTLRDTTSIEFLDFGLRRHESFAFEEEACVMASVIMKDRFRGSSTVSISEKLGLPTSGTMAHELMMVAVALASSESPEAMIGAQYDVLRKWESLFPNRLIFLPDAYGTEQFFRNMPEDFARHVAHTWKGGRWDSGDAIEEGERHVAFFRKHGVDPWKADKLGVPSDGLDVPLMQKLDRHFIQEKIIRLLCGWGTNFTNPFKGCHPRGGEQAVIWGNPVGLTWNEICGGQSIVVKVDSVNGIPAAKVSNNPNKGTGSILALERDRCVFGVGVQETQEVLV